MPIISMLTVHDKQLVDDIPVEKLLVHDVPVDIICTPTQVIFTKTTIPKPQGLASSYHLFSLRISLVLPNIGEFCMQGFTGKSYLQKDWAKSEF